MERLGDGPKVVFDRFYLSSDQHRRLSSDVCLLGDGFPSLCREGLGVGPPLGRRKAWPLQLGVAFAFFAPLRDTTWRALLL